VFGGADGYRLGEAQSAPPLSGAPGLGLAEARNVRNQLRGVARVKWRLETIAPVVDTGVTSIWHLDKYFFGFSGILQPPRVHELCAFTPRVRNLLLWHIGGLGLVMAKQICAPEDMRRKDDPLGRRNAPACRLLVLPKRFEPVIDAMVNGLSEDVTVEGVTIPAGRPLSARQAALALGVRLRALRDIYDTPLFGEALSKALLSRRRAEEPKNLHVAVSIRDSEGDGSAAFQRARLAAVDSIRDKSSSGTRVEVNVNQQANISAGYVIRLPATDRPAIDGRVVEQE
jgi:hypothetical protein